jgi:uncharacterized protein
MLRKKQFVRSFTPAWGDSHASSIRLLEGICRLAEWSEMLLRRGINTSPPSRRRFEALIKGLERVLVAYSGGIDSTLVLKVAHQQLGAEAVAATAVSASLARGDLDDSQRIAEEIGVHHVLLESSEVDDPRYRRNDPNRCYFCKTNVYEALIAHAGTEGFTWILDGTNADDLGDHRPGLRAAREHGVRSPLQECGIGKEEIRAWARELGLPNWDKPANACLSSRIPYGSEVTPAKLGQVEAAEAALKKLGFGNFRVRHHGQVARLELDPEDLARAVTERSGIVAAVKAAGFLYVTLDLAGFRSGSMNEAIKTTTEDIP